jgi:hypothetical protein
MIDREPSLLMQNAKHCSLIDVGDTSPRTLCHFWDLCVSPSSAHPQDPNPQTSPPLAPLP